MDSTPNYISPRTTNTAFLIFFKLFEYDKYARFDRSCSRKAFFKYGNSSLHIYLSSVAKQALVRLLRGRVVMAADLYTTITYRLRWSRVRSTPEEEYTRMVRSCE